MNRNRKLTKIITGRVLSKIRREDAAVILIFDDGSKLKIKTAETKISEIPSDIAPTKPALPVSPLETKSLINELQAKAETSLDKSAKSASDVLPAPNETKTGGKVKTVSQEDIHFRLEFEDGTSFSIETLEEMASVMLRDKDGVMEYAD